MCVCVCGRRPLSESERPENFGYLGERPQVSRIFRDECCFDGVCVGRKISIVLRSRVHTSREIGDVASCGHCICCRIKVDHFKPIFPANRKSFLKAFRAQQQMAAVAAATAAAAGLKAVPGTDGTGQGSSQLHHGIHQSVFLSAMATSPSTKVSWCTQVQPSHSPAPNQGN